MCKSNDLKKIYDINNKYIFDVLSNTVEGFNHCYVCDKELCDDNFNLLRLPTEERMICLCNGCARKFRKQAKLHKKIINFRDSKLIKQLEHNEISVIELLKDQFIELSFTHKIWLDSQRRINEEKRNKGKD